jgi:hypothetical protein
VLPRRHIYTAVTTAARAAFCAWRRSEQIRVPIVNGSIASRAAGLWFSARVGYAFEEKHMLRSRMLLASLALTGALGIGAATSLAQTPSAPPKDTSRAASMSAQASETMTGVSKWTRRQWHDAKAKRQKEKDAWNGCQNEAKTQNLSGRRSWQFLYDCMTKS